MAAMVTTITGNVANPELRFTPSGKAVFNFSLPVNKRVKDASGEWVDGEPTWVKVAVWDKLGENAAATLTQGTRAIVTGEVENRAWEKDGEKKFSLEMNASEIGADLRFHVGEMSKAGQSASGGASKQTASRRPDPAQYGDEEPF